MLIKIVYNFIKLCLKYVFKYFREPAIWVDQITLICHAIKEGMNEGWVEGKRGIESKMMENDRRYYKLSSHAPG